MNESEKKSEKLNQDTKLVSIRMNLDLYNRLEKKRKAEGWSTLNKFATSIFEDHLDEGNYATRIANKDIKEYRELVSQQKEFMDNIQSVLQVTAKESNPNDISDYENKKGQILEALKTPLTFDRLVKVTAIRESEVFIIISHLYDTNKIMYNTKREYSKV